MMRRVWCVVKGVVSCVGFGVLQGCQKQGGWGSPSRPTFRGNIMPH